MIFVPGLHVSGSDIGGFIKRRNHEKSYGTLTIYFENKIAIEQKKSEPGKKQMFKLINLEQ